MDKSINENWTNMFSRPDGIADTEKLLAVCKVIEPTPNFPDRKPEMIVYTGIGELGWVYKGYFGTAPDNNRLDTNDIVHLKVKPRRVKTINVDTITLRPGKAMEFRNCKELFAYLVKEKGYMYFKV